MAAGCAPAATAAADLDGMPWPWDSTGRTGARPDGRDPEVTEVKEARLAEGATSVPAARNITAATLRAWGLEELSEAMTLVVSELVTNALRHARPTVGAAQQASIHLYLVRQGRDVACLVTDASNLAPVRKELVDGNVVAETGRGLHIVAACSRRWGWTRLGPGGGKAVWALFRPPK